MPHRRRIVLTGMGVVSPLGLDRTTFVEALRQRRSGLRAIRHFDATGLPIRIAGELPNFQGRNYLQKKDRKLLKMMAPTVQQAVASARLAIDDAGLKIDDTDPSRLGVVLGIGIIPGEIMDLGPAAHASFDPEADRLDLRRWGHEGMAEMQPMWMLNHVPNMSACHVSILNNAQGPNNTITQSDVASLLAVGEAVNVVRRGTADVMLAGGSDNRAVLLAMIRYPLFAEMSARNDDPEHAVRPFDTHREGQVMGDGSGTLVVEELDHARRRGGPILAEVLGFAAGFDRGRTGAGLARVMRQALKRAGLTPADLDHINSGAPGTRADDAWEARAIAELLGDADVPVLAAKSYFGNLGTASSVIEIMASLAPMMKGWRPGTLNHHETAPDCPVRVLRETGPVRRPVFMKIAGTDLGQCAVLVLRRWEEQP